MSDIIVNRKLCACGAPRHVSAKGVLANTCLSEECLHKFLFTRRRRQEGKRKRVPSAIPSDSIKDQLPALLARRLRNR